MEPDGRDAVVFKKTGVAVDRGAGSFTNDPGLGRHGNPRVDLSSRCVGHAVHRPELLLAMRQCEMVSNLAAGVAGCEGDMTWRMPVLGNDHRRKHVHELVDGLDDAVSTWHGQLTSRKEISLRINHNKHRRAGGHSHVS